VLAGGLEQPLEGYTVVSVLGTSVINIGIGLLIHRSVYCSKDRLGRLLNWRPVVFIGVLSYSLYVWQQLFLNRNSSAWVNAFPQNLILAVGAALGSYLLIEKPLLGLRGRLRTKSLHESENHARLHVESQLIPVDKAPCLAAEAKK
jgi:peptidoglycan/LPS O-acetylase OafA/YrhL